MILTAQFLLAHLPAGKPRWTAAICAAVFAGLNTTVMQFGTVAQAYGSGLFFGVAAFRAAAGRCAANPHGSRLPPVCFLAWRPGVLCLRRRSRRFYFRGSCGTSRGTTAQAIAGINAWLFWPARRSLFGPVAAAVQRSAAAGFFQHLPISGSLPARELAGRHAARSRRPDFLARFAAGIVSGLAGAGRSFGECCGNPHGARNSIAGMVVSRSCALPCVGPSDVRTLFRFSSPFREHFGSRGTVRFRLAAHRRDRGHAVRAELCAPVV